MAGSREGGEKGNTIQSNLFLFPLARLDRADKGVGVRNSSAYLVAGSDQVLLSKPWISRFPEVRDAVSRSPSPASWGEKAPFIARISTGFPTRRGRGREEELTNLSAGMTSEISSVTSKFCLCTPESLPSMSTIRGSKITYGERERPNIRNGDRYQPMWLFGAACYRNREGRGLTIGAKITSSYARNPYFFVGASGRRTTNS